MGASGATTEVLAQAAGVGVVEARTPGSHDDRRRPTGNRGALDRSEDGTGDEPVRQRQACQPAASAGDREAIASSQFNRQRCRGSTGGTARHGKAVPAASHLLQSFLRRQQDASERGQLGQADARVFTLATPPERASSLHPIFLFPVREVPT